MYRQNSDDLSEPVRNMALEDLGRCVDLALVLYTSRQAIPESYRKSSGFSEAIEYSEGRIGKCKMKIQGILIALGAPRSLLDENLPIDERAPLLAPVDPHPHDTATSSAFEGTLEPRLRHLVQSTRFFPFLSPSAVIPQPVDI